METIKRKSTFSLDKDMVALEDQLIAKYPDVPLSRIGFKLARVNEGKKVEIIKPDSMSDLRDLLKKGKMWLVPNREILLPLNAQDLVTNSSTVTDNAGAITQATEAEQNAQDTNASTVTDNAGAITQATKAEQSDLEDFILQPPKRRRPLRRAALRFQHSLGLRSNQNYVTAGHTTTIALPSSSAPQDIDLIEVIDSEDEELEQVMDSSFEPAIPNTKTCNNADIKSLLQAFQKKINKFDKQEIIVYRKRVLESAFRALKRPHFDVKCKLYVKFSGELGMDHGGPRREFFRLAIHELSEKSSLFEGTDGQKMFRHNLQALQEGHYRLAGKLIRMSLAQDGPAMGFLNRDVFRMMNRLEPDLKNFDLQLIPDIDIRNILQQLQRVDSEDSRDSFLSEHGDWMLDQGMQNTWRLKIADVPKTVHALVKQTIFYRTASEINQFVRGLDDVHGLATEVGSDPSKWEDLFCSMGEPLTKERLLGEFDIKWSITGSNRRGREEETNYSFELFLQDIEDEAVPVKIQDLLVFITGADKIPPAGFGSSIEIQFYDQEEGSLRLPFSSTCALTFSLPRGTGPDLLRDLLLRALKESMGFGKC